MKNSLCVGMINGVGNLRAKIQDGFCGQSIGRDATAKRFAGKVFHGDVRLAIDLAHFINRADVRVIQGGGGTRFPKDELARLRIGESVCREQFEGSVAVECFVPGAKDYTHTASASFFQHDVMGECLANHQEGPVRGMIGRRANRVKPRGPVARAPDQTPRPSSKLPGLGNFYCTFAYLLIEAWPRERGSGMSSNGNSLGNGKNGKNGKKRRRIIWAAIALAVLGGGGYGVKAALSPSRTIDPSKIASVERGDLARAVVATGKIQPLSKVAIKSKASGLVKKLYVDYGERVKQGQLLAELDKVQLAAAERAYRANLQAAEAALDSSKATLERNKVDAEGPDVPFLKLNMERAEQMFKDCVMSK